jgi:hypothetical protein
VRTGKRKRAFSLHDRSGRKTFAPLGAPAPEYGLPAGSAHARAKAVASFTLDSAGLIGSFHPGLLLKKQRNSLPQARTRVNTFFP